MPSDPIIGFCNKCGYTGPCEKGRYGYLMHSTPDGDQCAYSAAPIKDNDETVTAVIGTPTPMKFKTIYAVQQQGASYLSMCAARRTDAERVLRQSPGSRLVTIPGETDAAPQPTGDVLAAISHIEYMHSRGADISVAIDQLRRAVSAPTGDVLATAEAMADAAVNLIMRLGRCHSRQMGAGGQTTEACLARTAYINVPVTIDAELSEALAAYLAARNATTKMETPDANR